MDRTTLNGRTASAAAIAVAYVGVALLEGGYATSSLAWGAIGVWVLAGLMIAVRGSRWAPVPRAGAAAAACFAGLALLSALSMLWANDAGRAFDAILLPGAYAGLVVLVLVSPARDVPRIWLSGLAAGTTVVTILALLSRLDPGFLGTTSSASGALAIGAQGRLSYPIGYWNGLAACVAASLVILAWLSVEAKRREARATCVALAPLGGLALFFTSSRGGVLAVAVGIVILVVLERRRVQLVAGAILGIAASVLLSLFANARPELVHDVGGSVQRHQGLEVGLLAVALGVAIGAVRLFADSRLERVRLHLSPRARRWGALALVAVLVAAFVASDPAARVRSFETDSSTTTAPGQRSLLSTSGSGRAQFWHAALDAFTSHPVGGVGAGNYALYWNAHPRAPVVTGNAHSFFLEELAELGIPGILLALGPFVIAAIAAARRWRAAPAVAPALAVLGAAAVGAAIDWTWLIPAAFGVGVVAIGLLTGSATEQPAAVGLGDRNFAPRSGFGLGVSALLLGWGFVWVAGITLFATLKLDASRSAVAGGDLASAADDAHAAASVEPFSPEPQIQLALIYELAGARTRARSAAGEAIDQASDDWRGWAIAARIDRRLGRGSAARREQARARALAPVPLPPAFRPRSGA